MTLFEAASWAPSSYNEQPWRFVYATREQQEKYDLLFSFLGEWNQAWVKSAPMLAVGIIKKNYTHNNKPNKHAAHDLGMASATLAQQATAMGLHVHFMGGFDATIANEGLNLGDDFEAYTMFVVGYLGEVADLPESYREEEIKPRTRKPLSTLVFNGAL